MESCLYRLFILSVFDSLCCSGQILEWAPLWPRLEELTVDENNITELQRCVCVCVHVHVYWAHFTVCVCFTWSCLCVCASLCVFYVCVRALGVTTLRLMH